MIEVIARQQSAAHAKGVLNMWVVYDHPKDFPQGYCARCFELDQPTNVVLTGELEEIRDNLERCGLVKLMRDPTDDPVIMETWV